MSFNMFDVMGIAIITNFLPKEECKKISKNIFEIHNSGGTYKDKHCTLSDSLYSPKVLDDLLYEKKEDVEILTQKKLLPTYTFCRIYRPGEQLTKHRDKNECEISITLTLDVDPETTHWPIFFLKESPVEVFLDVGDIALYKGTDLLHWRETFTGNYQLQAFLHYVDASGRYKNLHESERKKIKEMAKK